MHVCELIVLYFVFDKKPNVERERDGEKERKIYAKIIDLRYALDGWITCDFTSFSTVFQSYQDDGRMIIKGCVQWNPVYG